MSEDFDNSAEGHFSAFIPLTIVLAGFILWIGFQDYALNSQRVEYDKQITAAMPTYNQAVVYANRYKGLLKELIEVSAKDQAAAAIVKEAMQAGWISFQPNTPANGATGAAPAETGTAAPAAK